MKKARFLKSIKNIHFMGIGGSGMSAVASIARVYGFKVSGCDLDEDTIYTHDLVKRGVKIYNRHDVNHLKGIDRLAVTPAIFDLAADQPELIKAKKKGIVLTWQEFMGRYLQEEKYIVAIAGTHGKTTTTAMLGLTLEKAGKDPTVELGALISEWKTNFRAGKSQYFVCEADEFNNNFHHYQSDIMVVTNVEMDHPEFFPNYEAYLKSFETFVRRSRKHSYLVICRDDSGSKELMSRLSDWPGTIIPYSLNEWKKEGLVTKFSGDHNRRNALAAVKVAQILGIKRKMVKEVLANFTGAGRRMELVGQIDGIRIYDDYAHHPTEVKATLTGARESFPRRKIWAVFQPHMYSRTKVLLKKFTSVFSEADRVIIVNIFASREAKDEKKRNIHAKDLVAQIKHPRKKYLPSLSEAADYLARQAKKGEAVICMGAGDITKVSRYWLLLKSLKVQGFKINEPLASHTTFKIGGPADLFFEAKTTDELVNAVKLAKKYDIPYFILGGGSNLLISDNGFKGLVIQVRNEKLKIESTSGGAKEKITVGAGLNLPKLLNKAAGSGLVGLEFAAGIPGTVGGAIVGNAGAWRQNIGEKTTRVKALTQNGAVKWVNYQDCRFGYRQSRFQNSKEIVLEVELELEKGNRQGIAKKMKINLEKRQNQPRQSSAGCIFVNPEHAAAGEMIDQCGLKTSRVGDAQISPKHANFIVNLGKAKATDVIQLIKLAKEKVKKKFGIELKEEICLVGLGRIERDN